MLWMCFGPCPLQEDNKWIGPAAPKQPKKYYTVHGHAAKVEACAKTRCKEGGNNFTCRWSEVFGGVVMPQSNPVKTEKDGWVFFLTRTLKTVFKSRMLKPHAADTFFIVVLSAVRYGDKLSKKEKLQWQTTYGNICHWDKNSYISYAPVQWP